MVIGRLRAPPYVFHLFLFISGPVEGSNQMGKQKKTRVKFGFG